MKKRPSKINSSVHLFIGLLYTNHQKKNGNTCKLPLWGGGQTTEFKWTILSLWAFPKTHANYVTKNSNYFCEFKRGKISLKDNSYIFIIILVILDTNFLNLKKNLCFYILFYLPEKAIQFGHVWKKSIWLIKLQNKYHCSLKYQLLLLFPSRTPRLGEKLISESGFPSNMVSFKFQRTKITWSAIYSKTRCLHFTSGIFSSN